LVKVIGIEGHGFDSKEAAKPHGLELAKHWVDEHGSATKR
jgi:hypothetical protein